MSTNYKYSGNELDIFAVATNYKQYLFSYLLVYTKWEILEVWAGIGSNIKYLLNKYVNTYTCTEPDKVLFEQIPIKIKNMPIIKYNSFLYSLDSMTDKHYDTIFYIDVLEHICDDVEELSLAVEKLNKGGRIIVVAPAHNFLFSNFDEAVGHFRRYNKSMLSKIKIQNICIKKIFYVDSIGFFLSLANKFLSQREPTLKQIVFYDHIIVPCSKIFDRLLRNKFGKTVVCIFKKTI